MAVDRTKYPKCKYHASLSAVVVADPDEEKALGPGWFDHPDLVGVEESRPKLITKPAVEFAESKIKRAAAESVSESAGSDPYRSSVPPYKQHYKGE